MSYLVLARKWRPRGFDNLIGQDPISRILKNAISQGKIAHAYIFSGPRGVGKTSTARILAKAMNCKEGPTPTPCGVCASCIGITEGSSVDVIEIDGASNNSVDDIRDLREKVKYAPSSSQHKVYIIDEAHMLSGSAFNALLKTLEEPPSHVIFVLATTALKKIPPTILSRCQHMPFRRITTHAIKERLAAIADEERITVAALALTLIARAADGSMRDALTILDQLSAVSAEISEEDVKSLLGMADLDMLLRISKAILCGDRGEILETIHLLSDQGTDMRSFTKELVQFFRNLLVVSVMRKPEDVLDLSTEEIASVRGIISASSDDQLSLMLSEIVKAEADVRNASSPRLALEMSLMRASFLSTLKPLKEVIEHIDRYRREFVKEQPDTPVLEKNPMEMKEADRKGKEVLLEEKPSKERPEDSAVPAVHSETALSSHESAETHPDEESRESIGHESPVKEERTARTEDIANDMIASWKRTLERIDAPLASKISKAEVACKGNELHLILNGGHGLFEDAIRKNLKRLEALLAEESGRTIRIKVTTAKKGKTRKKELKDEIMGEPVIKEVMELFDGRVVDIAPSKKSEYTINGGDDV